MPFCKYCGAKNDSDANFCTECGKKIKVHTPPKVTKTEQMQSPAVTGKSNTTPANIQQTPAHSEIILRHWTEDEERAFNERRMNYVISMNVFTTALKRQNSETSNDIDLDIWHIIEKTLAEKYGFGDNSIFRYESPSALFGDSSAPVRQTTHGSSRTYNKKNKEYWSQFGTYNEDDDTE